MRTVVRFYRVWDLLAEDALPFAEWVNTVPKISTIISTCPEIDIAGPTFNTILAEAKEAGVIAQPRLDVFLAEADKLSNPSFGSST